jgi:hypothetical protein
MESDEDLSSPSRAIKYRKCSIQNCSGDRKKGSLFHLPKKREKREKLLTSMQISDPGKNFIVCYKHFDENDFNGNCKLCCKLNIILKRLFVVTEKRKRLKKEAIPRKHTETNNSCAEIEPIKGITQIQGTRLSRILLLILTISKFF